MASNDWEIEFDTDAVKDLDNLPSAVKREIVKKIRWLRDNFDDTTPQSLGGEWRGFFKLRTGDYRIIYKIDWNRYLLTVSLIDHRSKVYKRRRR
ncbi:MAG: type II toxin-antitoxin system RelE/ParE family toxin [bacterium]|nr:type II toxin-antitoxin system RelE/ParE family toxin [bacterium]